MTVPHGKSTKVYAAGYDLTSYLSSVQPSAESEVSETTAFGSDSRTYIVGLMDATLTTQGFWESDHSNDDASDDVLSSLLASDGSKWVVLPPGDSFGNQGYGFQAIETKYEQDSPVKDAVTVSADAQSQVGFEAIKVLHVKGAETTDGNGSSLDNTDPTTNGGVGYLQLFSAESGNAITVKVQHSTDASSWSDLITFTAADDRTTQRTAVSGTVNRYLRASWTFASSPSTGATFFVGFGRK